MMASCSEVKKKKKREREQCGSIFGEEEQRQEQDGITKERRGKDKGKERKRTTKKKSSPTTVKLEDPREGADAASRMAAAASFRRPDYNSVRESSSAMLDKLRTFLPQLEKANQQLSRDVEVDGIKKYDIEQVEEHEEQCIEMDLGLGLFDVHDAATARALEAENRGEIHPETSNGDDDAHLPSSTMNGGENEASDAIQNALLLQRGLQSQVQNLQKKKKNKILIEDVTKEEDDCKKESGGPND